MDSEQAKKYEALSQRVAKKVYGAASWGVLLAATVLFYMLLQGYVGDTPSFLQLPLVSLGVALVPAFWARFVFVSIMASRLRQTHSFDELEKKWTSLGSD